MIFLNTAIKNVFWQNSLNTDLVRVSNVMTGEESSKKWHLEFFEEKKSTNMLPIK